MDWRAPYRWTIAGPAWIIKSGDPTEPYAYVWATRPPAEFYLQRFRLEWGETSLRVVPVPYSGKG